MRKTILTTVAAAAAIIGLSACEMPEEEGTAADRAVQQVDKEKGARPEKSTGSESAPEDDMTVSQKNAIGSAEQYLDYSAFSRKGLIEQLEFEDYSKKDATFAVDYISPNWNNQAALAAKDYLEYQSFSRQGLLEQLEFEGYTTAQATHGVNQTGL
jgi:hypothetical protein